MADVYFTCRTLPNDLSYIYTHISCIYKVVFKLNFLSRKYIPTALVSFNYYEFKQFIRENVRDSY